MEYFRFSSFNLFALVLLLQSTRLIIFARNISFTADGTWGPATTEQCSHFLCTPSNLTWIPSYQSTYYDHLTGCVALQKKGITHIFFHGDSYMRQIYEAMLISLNGNYESGAMNAELDTKQECRYHEQFNKKICASKMFDGLAKVCNDSIVLDPFINPISTLNDCKGKKGTVLLWSFGNHKIGPHRNGINNYALYQEMFQKTTCPMLIDHSKHKHYPENMYEEDCTLWWLPTHYRFKAYFPEEVPGRVKEYNEKMREFFDAGECGPMNYIDVFNMTKHLAVTHPHDAARMTYDSVHWDMEVNMVKAQIIINALVA